MKIQLTTNFGQARGVQSHQWFSTLMDAQDYCEAIIKKYEPAQNQANKLDLIQDCNVKGLTQLMSGVNKFHFQWID